MFDVGDTVTVKLNANRIKTGPFQFTKEMKKYLGGEFVIRNVFSTSGSHRFYRLRNEDDDMWGWAFNEEWLESTKEIKIKESDFNELLCLK